MQQLLIVIKKLQKDFPYKEIKFTDEFYNITGLIILRVLIYNDYIYRKNMTCNDRMIFFGTTKPTCWFSAEEINILNKNIELEFIAKSIAALRTSDIDKINIYVEGVRVID